MGGVYTPPPPSLRQSLVEHSGTNGVARGGTLSTLIVELNVTLNVYLNGIHPWAFSKQ